MQWVVNVHFIYVLTLSILYNLFLLSKVSICNDSPFWSGFERKTDYHRAQGENAAGDRLKTLTVWCTKLH